MSDSSEVWKLDEVIERLHARGWDVKIQVWHQLPEEYMSPRKYVQIGSVRQGNVAIRTKGDETVSEVFKRAVIELIDAGYVDARVWG